MMDLFTEYTCYIMKIGTVRQDLIGSAKYEVQSVEYRIRNYLTYIWVHHISETADL
jgi:hypothetical protein